MSKTETEKKPKKPKKEGGISKLNILISVLGLMMSGVWFYANWRLNSLY
ncbi:MAG: hypothetical protein ACI9LG_000308 [Moritella dasanensis]|jgi:hypothetical protein